jgi:hypothetical protein
MAFPFLLVSCTVPLYISTPSPLCIGYLWPIRSTKPCHC